MKNINVGLIKYLLVLSLVFPIISHSSNKVEKLGLDLNQCSIGAKDPILFSELFVGQNFDLTEIKMVNAKKKKLLGRRLENDEYEISSELKTISDNLLNKLSRFITPSSVMIGTNKNGGAGWYANEIKLNGRDHGNEYQLALSISIYGNDAKINGVISEETTLQEFVSFFKGRVYNSNELASETEVKKYLDCNGILLKVNFIGMGYRKSLYKLGHIEIDLLNSVSKKISSSETPVYRLEKDVFKVKNKRQQYLIELANDDDWLTGVWEYGSDSAMALYSLFEKNESGYKVSNYFPRYSVSWWTGKIVKTENSLETWNYEIVGNSIQLSQIPTDIEIHQNGTLISSKKDNYPQFTNYYQRRYLITDPYQLGNLSLNHFITGEASLREDLDRIIKINKVIPHYDEISKSKGLKDSAHIKEIKEIKSIINAKEKIYLTEIVTGRYPQSGYCGASTDFGHYWVHLKKHGEKWQIENELMLVANDCGSSTLRSKLEDISKSELLLSKNDIETNGRVRTDCHIINKSSLQIIKSDCSILNEKISHYYNEVGLEAFKNRNFTTARKKFINATNEHKENFDAWSNLGLTYLKEQDYQNAIAASMRVVDQPEVKSSLKANASFNIGMAYEKQKDFENALVYYKKADLFSTSNTRNKAIKDLETKINETNTSLKMQ